MRVTARQPALLASRAPEALPDGAGALARRVHRRGHQAIPPRAEAVAPEPAAPADEFAPACPEFENRPLIRRQWPDLLRSTRNVTTAASDSSYQTLKRRFARLMPSRPSVGASHRSPAPSWSPSAWSGFAASGQLSAVSA